MTRYTYTALGVDGITLSGKEVAASSGAIHLRLLGRGLQPLSVIEKKAFLNFSVRSKKVPKKDVMRFSRQLGAFLKAGIPVLEALEVITDETINRTFKTALTEIIDAITAGDTFAIAARAHPDVFPQYYIGILKSAELSGNLDLVLGQLADYLERETDARSKVSSALVYPGIVVLASIVTVGVLTGFVLPRFQTFFASLNAKLPLPTRMLLDAAHFLTSRWYMIGGVLLILGLTGLVTSRTKSGRTQIDSLILKIPVAGDLLKHIMIERICRILASMMRAGVPLPDALTVTADATSNTVYRNGLGAMREEMLVGQGLAGPLARTGIFPPAARQMFRVGEETGTLDDQLQLAADFYSRELDDKIKRFTSYFEPAVIVGVGLIVGFVAIALVSAMYGIYRQVQM